MASEGETTKIKKRFRFKTFSERLKEVNIDAIHRVRHVERSEETENSSKFIESLLERRSLDYTAQFKSFFYSVSSKSHSYKMVVYYQHDIIQALKKHLQESDSLALESLLKLLVSLSADLGPDFYPHFCIFFPILTNLLKTNDTNKLEWIFLSISMLFRNLWRYMVKDMENVLELYKSLLIGQHPVHIASFAAESISFLLRKMQDSKQIFVKLFDILNSNPKSKSGISQVLFHMLKTAQKQFHSKTESILPVILEFANPSLVGTYACEINCGCIEATIELLAQHTQKQFANPVWKPLLNHLQQCTNSSNDLIYASNLLRFLKTWCGVGHGSKIVDINELLAMLYHCTDLLKSVSKSDSTTMLYGTLCEVASIVLTEKKVEIDAIGKKHFLLTLVKSLVDFRSTLNLLTLLIKRSDFVNCFLDAFLLFCQEHIKLEDQFLSVIKVIVHYSLLDMSLPQDCLELENFKPRFLDFSLCHNNSNLTDISNIILSFINATDDWSAIWYCLVSLFSIKPCVEAMKKALLNLLKKLFQCRELDKEQLAVFSMCCQVCFKLYGSDIFNLFDSKQFISLLIIRSSCKHFLFVFDIVASKNSNILDDLSSNELNQLITLFERNLSSSDQALQRLSLKAILHLDQLYEPVCNACLCAIDIPITLTDIRSKIMSLSKLQQFKECINAERCIALRFLISNFYINFTTLWEPVQDFLRQYALPNSQDQFWHLIIDLMTDASHVIQSRANVVLASNSMLDKKDENELFTSVISGNIKSKNYISNERINHENYRLLLWKTLLSLPHPNALQHHVDNLISLLQNFLKKEFNKVDKQLILFDDLKDDPEDDPTCGKNIRKSSVTNLLVVMLKTFARFSFLPCHPQSEYLLQLFTDLIGHSENQLQLSAFACILNFKNPIVLKYKEKLRSFLDENKFQDIITHFSVTDLSSEERPVIIKMLLKILFGKMKAKEKLPVSGKAYADTRRSLIVRFLCAVNSEEMTAFTEMLCLPYISYINYLGLSDFDSLQRISEIDIPKVMSVGRQYGILKCIQLLLEECHLNLSLDTFSFLFRLLLKVNVINVSVITSKLETPTFTTAPKLVASLRNIKKHNLECILSLIKVYPQSACLNQSNIDLFFNMIIWPEIPKLFDECSGEPGFLLKVFHLFAERPTFLPLLVKLNLFNASDEFTSPIATLSYLLISEKCSSNIGSYIIEIFLCLLYGDLDLLKSPDSNTRDDESNFRTNIQKALTSSGSLCLEIDSSILISRFEFGLAMIMPYIDKILAYFAMKMKFSKKGFILPNKHLQFLSTVGKIITNEELLNTLTELMINHILSVTAKKLTEEEIDNDPYSLCLKSLAVIIRSPKHLVKLSKLLSRLTERQHRLLLVTVVQNSCKNDPSLFWTCDIVGRLNAWEKKKINEVDYETRLIAFEEILARLKSDQYPDLFEQNCSLFIPVMHCCLHSLQAYFADLSMRESVVRILQLLIKQINNLFAFDFDFALTTFQQLIQQLLLPCIQNGLQSPDTHVRHLWIRLLAATVSTFPNERTLIGLEVFLNESDPEADTFENLQHIQLHRQARGFRKVATVLKEQHNMISGKKSENDSSMDIDPSESKLLYQNSRHISSETAIKYILPIALQTLYNHKFGDDISYEDACIDLLQSCLLISPWYMFRKLVVKTMKSSSTLHPNIVFRIVNAVLATFPFDLSSYKWNNEKTTVAEETISNDFVIHQKKDEMSLDEINDVLQGEIVSKNQLSRSDAEQILIDINRVILPGLFNLLSVVTSKNPRFSNADVTFKTSIRKLPYAQPIVGLLIKLPESILKVNLPTVLLNVFAFLKHKDFLVRTAAVKSTVKILTVLGPSYFFVMLKQLDLSLPRGFQRHVLLHVVHNMVESLLKNAKIGIFDDSLALLLDILFRNLFGCVADEKKVVELKQKIPELQGSNKAFGLYGSVSKYIRKTDVSLLIHPFQNKLRDTQSHDDKSIIVKALQEIKNGLLYNDDFQPADMMKLMHGIISENVSTLFPPTKNKDDDKQKHNQPESCLILQPFPGRCGVKPAVKAIRTNTHVLVEFALNLLRSLLKKSTIDLANQEHLEMLDPIVTCLYQCLSSIHVQTAVSAIECLTKLYSTELPSLVTKSKEIIQTLFKISRENSQGIGNHSLAAASFHSLSELCSSDYGKDLNFTQLKLLLAYAEQDMHDSNRESQSFKLIKTIINWGLRSKEVTETIEKVQNIVVQSQSSESRAKARSLYIHYLTNYPIPPFKLEQHLQFLLTHLNYEYEDGRASSLFTLRSITTFFPDELLNEHGGMIFVPVSASMINDESEVCRKAAGAVIRMLLTRINKEMSEELFDFALQWFSEEESILQQRLGAMLICIFADVKETSIDGHVIKILPVLLRNLENTVKSDDDDDVQSVDQTLFHFLSTILSLLRRCRLTRSTRFYQFLTPIFEIVYSLLNHLHNWIQLTSSQIFGCIFTEWEPSELSPESCTKSCWFVVEDLEERLTQLTKIFCEQLRTRNVNELLAEQVIKNLLYLTRVFDNKYFRSIAVADSEDQVPVHKGVLLILRKLRAISILEQTFEAKTVVKRIAILKYCAAFCVKLDDPRRVVNLLLDPVFRGMNVSVWNSVEQPETITKLRQLSQEVLEIIKSKVDPESFPRIYMKLTQRIEKKQHARKEFRARQLVANPTLAAERKIQQHQRKKALSKRKAALKRSEFGYTSTKKRKTSRKDVFES